MCHTSLKAFPFSLDYLTRYTFTGIRYKGKLMLFKKNIYNKKKDKNKSCIKKKRIEFNKDLVPKYKLYILFGEIYKPIYYIY